MPESALSDSGRSGLLIKQLPQAFHQPQGYRIAPISLVIVCVNGVAHDFAVHLDFQLAESMQIVGVNIGTGRIDHVTAANGLRDGSRST